MYTNLQPAKTTLRARWNFSIIARPSKNHKIASCKLILGAPAESGAVCVLRKVLNIAIWPALSLSSAIIYRRPGHKNKNSSSPVAIFAPVNFKLSPLLLCLFAGWQKMASCVFIFVGEDSPGASWPCDISPGRSPPVPIIDPDTPPQKWRIGPKSLPWCTSINPNMIWRKKTHSDTHLINITRGCVYCSTKPMRSFWLYEVENEWERAQTNCCSAGERLSLSLALVSPTLIKMNTSRKWYFVNRWRGGSTFILLSAAITARPSADAPFWPVLWHFQILRCLPDALEQKIYICPAESETLPRLIIVGGGTLGIKVKWWRHFFTMWWAITLLNLLIESSFCGIESLRLMLFPGYKRSAMETIEALLLECIRD